MQMRARQLIVAGASLALVACSGGDDTAAPDVVSVSDSSNGQSVDDMTGGAPLTPTVPTSGPVTTEPRGVDGSDIDWANVDLTTIDWANLDITTVDLDAVSDNPSAANLDEATVAMIQERLAGSWGSGMATLTVGEESWNFSGLQCAFGHSATQSGVYSFSSTTFADLDGARAQLQVSIRDEQGQGRYSGDGVTAEIEFDDIDNVAEPAISVLASDATVTIDGNTITGSGQFRDQVGGVDGIAGTFAGSCGPGSVR